MTDVHTPEQRHRNMSAIKSKNTKPEIQVRQLIYSMGYRYRLHRKDLPGKPDLVFPKYKKVIFINGCYWHMHNCRYGKVVPKTNAEFWKTKRESNVVRDKKNRKDLKKSGWKYMIIWECQIKRNRITPKTINDFLN